MNTTGLLVFLGLGAVAGWLAGVLMKGGGCGVAADIAIGVVGSMIGGHLFRVLGISAGGLIGSIVTATTGASGLLFVVEDLNRHT